MKKQSRSWKLLNRIESSGFDIVYTKRIGKSVNCWQEDQDKEWFIQALYQALLDIIGDDEEYAEGDEIGQGRRYMQQEIRQRLAEFCGVEGGKE